MENDLEQRLRQLPEPRAPRTLHPRVMAAVAERAQRRVARPFFAWPIAAQAAFVTVLVLAVGGAGMWLSSLMTVTGWIPAGWDGVVIARAVNVVRDGQAALVAVRIFIGAFVSQPIVLCFVALVIVMTVACATFGAMLGRMANVRIQGAE